jgi:thiol:disulfide interchange protein
MNENLNVEDMFKNLSQQEMQLMADILSGKSKKINKKTKNNLLQKMQSFNVKENEEIKVSAEDVKAMTEEERIKYRESLKQKLKNKTKSQKLMRTSQKIENSKNKSMTNKKLAENIHNTTQENEDAELNEYVI